ncbi:MAG: hypothetical protein ACI8WB_003045 [Phenylobacterium sp.]|jgi:hypothetical protein
MKKFIGLSLSLLVSAMSTVAVAEEPILVIGASYADGSTPFNDNLDAPLGGTSVGLGSYLSLGNALARERSLSGHVINEAQGGATTFDRQACNPSCTPDVMWQGYDKQFTKALARVTVRDPGTGDITILNSKYVVITLSNDCLHSDAFGIPQNQTQQCTADDINDHVDRLVALGQRILDTGLTPIYLDAPTYDDLDLPLAESLFGLEWMIDQPTYEALGTVRHDRIEVELPEAVQLNAWKGFEHMGDGLHPTDKSTRKAAKRIARFIGKNDRQGGGE